MMIIYLKGLINKKIFIKNLIIIFLLLMLIIFLTLTKDYLKSKKDEEFNKIEYRTLLFSSDIIKESNLEENKNIIESYNINSNSFEVVFYTKDDLELFKKQYINQINFVQSNLTSTTELSINYIQVLNIIIYISKCLLFILITIFSVNNILDSTKEISLYSILGFSKKKAILNITLFLSLLYLFINFLLSIVIFLINKICFDISLIIASYINTYIIIIISTFLIFIISLKIITCKNNLELIKE